MEVNFIPLLPIRAKRQKGVKVFDGNMGECTLASGMLCTEIRRMFLKDAS